MEQNTLGYNLMKAMEKIYHNKFNIDVFYQGEIRILTFIASYNDTSKETPLLPSDISKTLNMTNPRVSKILNNLESKGFIKREFSTIDRRKVYIHITNDGLNYVENISLKTQESFNAIIQKIGESDTIELIRILNKISI